MTLFENESHIKWSILYYGLYGSTVESSSVFCSGVLLPGQKLSFPFVFKSPNAGVFTETWALQTGPVLAGGRGIRVTLRAVAFQEDTNADKRDELEVLQCMPVVCVDGPLV